MCQVLLPTVTRPSEWGLGGPRFRGLSTRTQYSSAPPVTLWQQHPCNSSYSVLKRPSTVSSSCASVLKDIISSSKGYLPRNKARPR